MAIQPQGVVTPGPFNERLMSIPMDPRSGTSDGTEPAGGAASTQRRSAPQSFPTLEDTDDALTFQTIEQLVRSQDRLARNRWAIDTYYRWKDAGVPYGRLDKIPNQHLWVAKLPPGMGHENAASVPNKLNDLNNKITDALLSDPPKPNPQAHTTDDGVDPAGELASEFLRLDGGEAGTNDVQQYRWGLRNALVAASSYLHYRLVDDLGGYQPYQVLAHPQATDPANPLVAQIPDPLTGQPIEQPAVDPILRYVSAPTKNAPEGQFVTDASEADRVWLPGIRIERLRREQVRCYPATAPIEEADACILLLWCTLAEGRAFWPETVGQMTPDQLMKLADWRPTMHEIIVPYTFRGGMADGMSGPSLGQVGSLSPLLQRRMFYYRLYVGASQEYEQGLEVDISGSGGGIILDRQTLDYTVTMPQGSTDTRCREIPLVQITPIQDTTDNDPMGESFDKRIAESTTASSTLYAGYLDALDIRNRPHVFIASTAPVDEDDWSNRSVPIILNPGDQAPSYEQFPPLPDIVKVVQDMHQQDDTASGLTATAQGLETDQAISGVSKQLSVRQAQVSLAGMQQQLQSAFTRGWRLKLQIVQAHFTTPRLLHYTGQGASAQARWFTGEDFAGIDDVGIEPGTGTMMTAEAKANYVQFIQTNNWLPADRAADVALAGIARDLGLPPDPTDGAIERAIFAWLQGPDPQWMQALQAAQQQAQAIQQQYQQHMQIAQLTGAPPVPPPQIPPPPPPPVNPFAPRPNDTEPDVAAKWVRRLSNLMMNPSYTAQPPAWRQLVDQKYGACRQALQPPPQPGQGQPQVDASYAQFVKDVTTKVLQASTTFVAKEVSGQTGAAPAPGAKPGAQPQMAMAQLNAEKQGYQKAVANIHATEPDPQLRAQKLQHAQQIYKSRIVTLDKPSAAASA